MAAAKEIFAVEKLRVEREAVILREISWRVKEGQHWVILGANGSGKSSLLSALTGYLVPTRGEMRIGEASFGGADWREVRTAVGLVSSSLGQHIEPEQTAREVVISGRDAQINLWRQDFSRGGAAIGGNSAAGARDVPEGSVLAFSFAGRTAADPDWAGPDGADEDAFSG